MDDITKRSEQFAGRAGLDPRQRDEAGRPMWAVFVATAATGHFDFLAIGASRAQAVGAVLDAWREHAKQTGADPTYLTADDINVVDGQYGQAFRDGSPYPRRKWS